MKGHKSDGRASSACEVDAYGVLFNELLEAVVEDGKERIDADSEAFESYIQRVRSKMHADVDQFKKRFSKGYGILLEQVKND